MAINRSSVSEQVENPPMRNKKKYVDIATPKPRPKNRKLAQMKADAQRAGRIVGKSVLVPLKMFESMFKSDPSIARKAGKELGLEFDKMAKGGKVGSKKKSASSKKKISGHNRLY